MLSPTHMNSSLQQAASNLKSIHLLRALLREASYLPDANARQYFRHYIVSRFKSYQPLHHATPPTNGQVLEKYRHRSFKRRKLSVIIERTRASQRKAHKGLSYIRRANQGELPCLFKILLLTYGRMGKRKYELLGDLLRPEETLSSEFKNSSYRGMHAPLHQLYYSEQRFLSFFDAPKKKSADHFVIEFSDRYPRLKTVVQTQANNGISLGKDIKRHHLVTPIRNIWERPMPIKRARNNVKRWYADTMTKLLPPLPNDEWDRLRALTAGENWVEFAKPRTPATELHPQLRDDHVHSRALIEKGFVLNKPTKADRQWGHQRPHNITPRFMRRLYAKILGVSCKLDWIEQWNKWVAVWGNKAIQSRSYAIPVDEALFAGVDAKGRVSRSGAATSRIALKDN